MDTNKIAKVKSPITWLPLKEVMLVLKKRGVEVSLIKLRSAGQKYDFAKRMEGKYHYVYHRYRAIKYFCSNPSEPVDGEVKISDVAKEADVNPIVIYWLIKKKKLSFRNIGNGQGVVYVNKTTALEIIKRNKERDYGKEEEKGK